MALTKRAKVLLAVLVALPVLGGAAVIGLLYLSMRVGGVVNEARAREAREREEKLSAHEVAATPEKAIRAYGTPAESRRSSDAFGRYVVLQWSRVELRYREGAAGVVSCVRLQPARRQMDCREADVILSGGHMP